jgi:hypothetical protein
MNIKTVRKALEEHLPTPKVEAIMAIIVKELEAPHQKLPPLDLVTCQEAALELRLHIESFYRWVKSHPEIVRYECHGSRYRVDRRQIIELQIKKPKPVV